MSRQKPTADGEDIDEDVDEQGECMGVRLESEDNPDDKQVNGESDRVIEKLRKNSVGLDVMTTLGMERLRFNRGVLAVAELGDGGSRRITLGGVGLCGDAPASLPRPYRPLASLGGETGVGGKSRLTFRLFAGRVGVSWIPAFRFPFLLPFLSSAPVLVPEDDFPF